MTILTFPKSFALNAASGIQKQLLVKIKPVMMDYNQSVEVASKPTDHYHRNAKDRTWLAPEDGLFADFYHSTPG